MRRWAVAPVALAIALVVAGLGGGQRVWAQAAYPSWFHERPTTGPDTLWAVGYAPAYADRRDGVALARRDAYESLRRARRVTLLTETFYEAGPGFGTSLEGRKVVEMGLPDTLRGVSYVDSTTTAGMTLVLATWAPDGDPASASVDRGISFSESRPDWVTKALRGTLRGQRTVGIAPRYYHLENSWQRAEKRARRTLAFETATKVQRLKKSTEAWRHDLQSMITGVRLRHTQVQARWADDEYCYVLLTGLVDEVVIP